MRNLLAVSKGGFQHQSAEFVSPGHPDRTADGISAQVVQEHLVHDPFAHVAAETILTSHGPIIMAGEITSTHRMSNENYRRLAREYIRDLGWRREFGYDPDTLVIQPMYVTQSQDIARGVERENISKLGAGDQGISVGYAKRNPRLSAKSDDLMPLSVSLSRALLFEIDEARRTTEIGDVLKPDMKSEVILQLNNHGEPVGIDQLVFALSHIDGIENEDIKKIIGPMVARVLDRYKFTYDLGKAIINGTGRFVKAGAPGDTGLTGRKLGVDHYGPAVPVGGGAIHGKDPSKVDATGAMLGRWLAKQIVGNGLADECLVRASWAIGHSMPLSVVFDFAGTEKHTIKKIMSLLQKVDLSLGAAIERFGMRDFSRSRLEYPKLAAWGPFGTPDDRSSRPWETVVAPSKWKEWRFKAG
jgi:S-adenosylmethionine synthetase